MASAIDYELQIKADKAEQALNKLLEAFEKSADNLGLSIGNTIGKDMVKSIQSNIKALKFDNINTSSILNTQSLTTDISNIKNQIAKIKFSAQTGVSVSDAEIKAAKLRIQQGLDTGKLTPINATGLFSSLETAARKAGVDTGVVLRNQIEQSVKTTNIGDGLKNGVKTSTTGIGDIIKGNIIAGLAVNSLTAVGVAAGSAISSGFNASIKFDQAISNIKSLGPEFKAAESSIRSLSLQLGKETSFSALQAAQGFEELIKAGLTFEQITKGGLKGALDLAAAGGIEVADAAEIASVALNTFRDDSLDVSGAANILAGTANASATNISELQFALKQSSAVAALSGQNFKDTATALGLLAQNGLKGSDAGTSLKVFLNNLIPTTEKATKAMEGLGISTQKGAVTSFIDAEGKFKSLRDITEILNKSTSGLSESQKSLALETIFGSDAIRAAAILSKNGAVEFDKFAESINKVSAADVAKERLNNLGGAIERFKSSLETKQIEFFGKALTGSLTDIIGGLEKSLNVLDFTSISDALAVVSKSIGDLFNAIGNIASIQGIGEPFKVFGQAIGAISIGTINSLTTFFKFLKDNPDVAKYLAAIATAATALGVALGVISVATGVLGFLTKIGLAITGLVATFNPVTVLILGIIAVITVLFSLWSTNFLGIQDITKKAIDFIGKEFNKGVEFVKKFIDDFGKKFNEGIEFVKKFADDSGKNLNKIGEDFKNAFDSAIKPIEDFKKGFDNLASDTGNYLDSVKTTITNKATELLAPLKAPFEEFKKAFDELFNAIKGRVDQLGNTLSSGFQIAFAAVSTPVSLFISFVTGKFNEFVTSIGNIFNGIGNTISLGFNIAFGVVTTAISLFVSFVTGKFNEFVTSVGNIFSGIGNTISLGFNIAFGVVTTAIGIFVSFVVGKFNELKAGLQFAFDFVKGLFIGLYNTVIQTIDNILQVFTGIFQLLTGIISGDGEKIKQGFNNILSGIKNIISGAVGIITAPFRNAFNSILDIARSFDFSSIGRNIINGITGGISSIANNIKNSIVNALSGAISAAKSFLGIQSPSKLFNLEVGQQIMFGAIKGIDAIAPQLQDSITNAFDNSIPNDPRSAINLANNPNSNTNNSNINNTINNNQRNIYYNNTTNFDLYGGLPKPFSV